MRYSIRLMGDLCLLCICIHVCYAASGSETTTRNLHRRRPEPYSEHSNNYRNTMTSPMNLNQCQNLDEYLNLPNVVDAAALGNSENTRMIPRTSRRPKTGPADYATFHRTGTKQPSSQRMDTRREERKKDAAHRTKP